MAIKIQGNTIIDDGRNIVNAGITTVTSVSIGNTQVISSERQLQNIASLDAVTTATIESAISNAPNTFSNLAVTGISTLGITSVTNLNVTGVATATTFIGNLTGTATTASSVTLNSVGLGTHTYGDYVKDLTGTANQITVTSGTGEGSSPRLSVPNQFTAPQDVTVTRDLQVNRNLNVNGNITIGGTAATLFTTEFKVYDPDIVLGFRTDGSGNDISTDNTANHGGIAIASTEGSPLVQLFIAGIETNPATYKKIMWFKSGTFAGLGTDAWLANYAVGIGSTQFPTGTRLAAGSVQITERDLAVVRNINASGIVTATGGFVGNLTGNSSSATYATTAGIATVAQGLTGTPNITVGIITASSGNFSGIITSSGLRVTGVSTLGIITSGNIFSTGIVTATSFSGSGTNLTGIVTSIVAGTNVTISGSTGQVTINATGGGGGSSLTIYDGYPNLIGVVTSIDFGSNLTVTSVSSGIATVNATGGGGGASVIGMSKNVSSHIASAGQTTFNATYTVGFVDVYMNGAKLSESQYTATTGTSIVLNEGASLNDIVEIVGFVGGINGVGIATAGGVVGTGVTLFDFRGPGISTVTVSSGIGTINITGGTSSSSRSGTIVNELDVMLFG